MGEICTSGHEAAYQMNCATTFTHSPSHFFSCYTLHVMFYPLSALLPPHHLSCCTAAALSGCIAPMGIDILSFINRDLTGQQHFCCTDELSPGLQKRGGGTHRAETTHTTMRGRVVSRLTTEDERGGIHTWSDLVTSGSSHHNCSCQLC